MDEFGAAFVAEEGCDFAGFFTGDFFSVRFRIGGETAAEFATIEGANDHSVAAIEVAADAFDAGGQQAAALRQGLLCASIDLDEACGLQLAGDAGSELSRGGMKTKVEAAKIALSSGTHMVIASGKVMHPLRAIADGCLCTWFLASSDPVSSRKRWIAGQLEPAGFIEIDAGAEKALAQGRSLLPAGVKRVGGDFDRGDAVIIRSIDGRELGRGLIAYSNADATKIAGKKSGEIAALLGHEGRAELIHRDDMALTRL